MPTRQVPIDMLDQFFFLNHHGPQVYEPNNSGLPFEPHPHKGFETVTFILEGSLVHSDNSGHVSEITAGGVQWMTAGKGIVHSEMSSNEFKKNGGPIEMLQLWVNLPKEKKSLEPAYTGLQRNDIPKIDVGTNAKANLISGMLNGQKGPLESSTDVMMSWLEFGKGSSFNTEVDPSREVFFYVVSGTIEVNRETAGERTLVEFEKDGSQLEVSSANGAVVLFGHAEPTGDPVVAEGPFVMNSKEEIRQAIKDYRSGKFGRTIEDH
jgi:redox-sensitive bicupin YhaK (pirin superfamily)